jgi:hypothetical protein
MALGENVLLQLIGIEHLNKKKPHDVAANTQKHPWIFF